eukprot:Em0013g858a
MLVSYVFTIVVLSCVTNVDCVPCNSTSNKPFIITPATQLVSLGDTNVQIHCAAEPNEMCLWKWSMLLNAKTNQWIQVEDNATLPTWGVALLSNGSLLIPSITSLSITNYYCFRSGPPYRASPLATIYLRTPLQYVNGQTSFCVDSGSTGNFSFLAIGYPVPNVTLYKMGVLGQWSLVNDSRFVVSVSSVTVMGAKGTDDGMYLINGTNGFSSNQLAFRLNVSDSDVPTANMPSDITIRQLNQPTSVNCSVQSPSLHHIGCRGQMIDSNLSITWTREGQAVSQDSTQSVYAVNFLANGVSVLHFQSMQKNQTGQYTCIVSNSRGSGSSSISVYGPPDSVIDVSSMSQEGVVTLVWTPPTPGPFEISYTVYYGLVNSSMKLVNTTKPSVQLPGLPQGSYAAFVVTVGKVSSTTSTSGPSQTVKFYVQPDTGLPVVINAVIAGAIILAVLVAIAIMCLGAFLYIRRQRAYQLSSNNWMIYDEKPQTSSAVELVPSITLPSNGDIATSLHEQDYLSNEDEVDPKWEFPREVLQFTEIIYEGSSTVLYRGAAPGIRGEKVIDVAIKMCKADVSEKEMRAALLADMEHLARLESHPNVVGLLRVCTVESPVCMVVEYMCHGDLLGFLRASRGHHGMYTVFPSSDDNLPPQVNLTSRDLISIATKIASGMAFLADRKVVHGSLCASSVLVGTSLDIKINLRGYELSRDCVFKWMSPETLYDGTLSTNSDIWSFGITLWEIVTVGGTPYAEILSGDLYPQLCNGMRLPRPLHCAQEVYDIMKACWEAAPTRRLPFYQLQASLEALANVVSEGHLLCKDACDLSPHGLTQVLLDFGQYDSEQYSQFNENSLTTLL